MHIKAQGHAVIVDPTGPNTNVEYDTMTCAHCQFVMCVAVGRGPQDAGDFCVKCRSLICPDCAAKKTCKPWLSRRSA